MEQTLSLFDTCENTEQKTQEQEAQLIALRDRQLSQLSAESVAAEPADEVAPEVAPEQAPFVEDEAKTYEKEEIIGDVTEYFHGDALAASVWVDKYAMKNREGKLVERTPDDMHRRLAREFARIEKRYPNPMSEDEIFHLLKDFRYVIPQGSPMAGIGNNYQVVSLSNCFVIGNGENADSYGGIMQMDEEQVQLMKRRGGVGHDLSALRPAGSNVQNCALTSTGIVPFMERYSNSTREVAQDGRRGALMLTISIKHPDAEKFIDAKMTEGRITGANVSVRIDDEFMQCVNNGTPYTQQYPIHSDHPTYVQQVDAGKLWAKIIYNAWKSAEPGVLFWDTIHREAVPDCYADEGFLTESTNPCGEIPLCPYDSCRLIAINLFSYVKDPFTAKASFNMPLFKQHVASAQRLMDDLVDLRHERAHPEHYLVAIGMEFIAHRLRIGEAPAVEVPDAVAMLPGVVDHDHAANGEAVRRDSLRVVENALLVLEIGKLNPGVPLGLRNERKVRGLSARGEMPARRGEKSRAKVRPLFPKLDRRIASKRHHAVRKGAGKRLFAPHRAPLRRQHDGRGLVAVVVFPDVKGKRRGVEPKRLLRAKRRGTAPPALSGQQGHLEFFCAHDQCRCHRHRRNKTFHLLSLLFTVCTHAKTYFNKCASRGIYSTRGA